MNVFSKFGTSRREQRSLAYFKEPTVLFVKQDKNTGNVHVLFGWNFLNSTYPMLSTKSGLGLRKESVVKDAKHHVFFMR